MDQQPQSPHSPAHSGGGGSKTSTLRNKLEGELNFARGKTKTLSYKSPSPAPPSVARRRTVSSSNQPSSEESHEPPAPVVPEIPVAPVFTPPKSKGTKKASKEDKEKRSRKEEVTLKVLNSLPY